MNTVSLPDGTTIDFPDDTSPEKMSEVASGLWKQRTAKPSKPAEPTPTGPPEVSTLPEQSVQLGGGRPAPGKGAFGPRSMWQNVTTPVVNYPPEAIAQQLRFNPSQPAIGMALAALPPKLREDIIKGVSEGVAQNVVDPFLSPLGAGTMLAGGAIPKVAQKAMQIGFGVLGGMGVPGTVKRLGQAKTPGEASKELIGLGAEAGMAVGGVKGLAEGVAAVLPRTKAALSQVKPTTERPENAEREITQTGGVPTEQRVAPERVTEGQVEAGAPQRGGEGAPQAPNAPEGQVRNVLAPTTAEKPIQTPTPERFNSVEEILDYRNTRLREEESLYQTEIGLTPEEAHRLRNLLDREVSLDKFESKLTPEKRAAMIRFFDYSPYNKVGGPFEFWETDKRLNPEEISTETDKGLLSSAIATAAQRGIELKPNSDLFISAVIAARRLREVGGTQSDLARYIDQWSSRESSSLSDKIDFFKSVSGKVGVFLRSQGIELPEGELGKKAAAPPPVRPEGEPTRVAAAAATTEPSGPGEAVTAAPPAASVSEATTSQGVKQAAEPIWSKTNIDEMFAAPMWTEKYKGMTESIRHLREQSTDNPVAAVPLPSYKYLTFSEKQDLLAHGFTFTVDRMGEPHLSVSREAKVDTLRRQVKEKAAQRLQATQAEPQTAPEGGATKGAEAAAAQPDFVGLGAAAAGEETGRPTIGELIPSRAGTAPTPAPTTAEGSVLQRVGQLFSRESMRDTGRALAGTLGTVLGKTLPKITKLNRLVGELGARYISSRIYARYAAPIFSRDVMAGLNIDPVKFGAALSEDNLRSIKEAHLRKASESTDPAEQARLNEMANNVFSFVGERGTFRTESEYQDYLRRPEVQEAIRRHISNWKAVIEPQYREAMMLDPELELPERGLQTGARVNLAPVLEGRPIPPGAVWSSRPGSLLGTLRRKSPFGVLAKGTGEAYIPNYDDLIANTFFKQTEIANKNAFDKALVEHGLAVIDKPGQHPVVGGEQTVAFPLTRRTVVIPGQGAVGQNQMIYVRRSLAKEYRVASNVDANPYEGFIATKINNAFSQAALAGLTDATVHVSNLSTSLAQLPVSKLGLLTDSLLSAAGRLDLPVAGVRAIKKGVPEVAGGLLKRSPLLKRITPDRVVRAIEDAYWKNQTQLASLAEIGALKEPHVLSNLPPLKQMSQLIQWYDRTTRMVLDDAYTDLAQRGVVENTETARREFINQVGQYNKRAQGAIVRFFRQSGLGPFITAGRAFNVLGARAATLSPGVKATSPMMALALKANALAKWTGTLSFVALMNYLITGKTTGTPGTPIGSISSNDKDELGRNKSFSVINLTGQGRALRVTGLRGFIEAKRKGLPTPVAEDAAMRDIVNSAIGPMAGPAIRGAFVAATGQAPAVSISRVSRVVPPGESQTAENIKTALLEANPVIAGAVESGKPGKSWKDAVARQLPRFTMQVTQPERMIQDYPIIVRKAQANAYIDDVIHRARRIENSQERWKFITDSILKLSPEDQAHAWLTIRFRKVE